ncbi:hypothetical protein MMC25_001402 [Agyrium rufum]|nr:hypothetical protein [Agyrium rufum]
MLLQEAEKKADAKVNDIVIRNINKVYSRNPTVDLSAVLDQQLKVYTKLRIALRAVATTSSDEDDEKSTENIILPEHAHLSIPNDAKVIREFGPDLKSLAQSHATTSQNEPIASIKDSKDSDGIYAGLNKAIYSSKIIHGLGSTYVLALSSTLVVKIGRHIDLAHIETLKHIQQYAKSVPIPTIHGVLESQHLQFVFMSKADGITLESIWPRLGLIQKLNTIAAKHDLSGDQIGTRTS